MTIANVKVYTAPRPRTLHARYGFGVPVESSSGWAGMTMSWGTHGFEPGVGNSSRWTPASKLDSLQKRMGGHHRGVDTKLQARTRGLYTAGWGPHPLRNNSAETITFWWLRRLK